MVQTPGLTSVAVVPETVQTVAVNEVKLTGRPELADALRATVVPCTWPGIALKAIVWVSAIPVPFIGMVWVAGLPLKALSLSTAELVMGPLTVGRKLRLSLQL